MAAGNKKTKTKQTWPGGAFGGELVRCQENRCTARVADLGSSFSAEHGAPDSAAGRSQLAVISAEFAQCLIEHN